MSDRDLELLRHTLGWPSLHRNYFVANPDGDDFRSLAAMEAEGLVERFERPSFVPDAACFRVTEKGRLYVEERNPPPPSRSKRRYQQWLKVADGYPDLDFGGWLQGRHYEQRWEANR